jgi:hypothetical protein
MADTYVNKATEFIEKNRGGPFFFTSPHTATACRACASRFAGRT